MGTKLTPCTYDCYDALAPDEPFFVLRAKDPDAPKRVRDWAASAMEHQSHEPEKIAEAIACADAMSDWRVAHEESRALKADQWRLTCLERKIREAPGSITSSSNGMLTYVPDDGDAVQAQSLRALIDEMTKDDIPF